MPIIKEPRPLMIKIGSHEIAEGNKGSISSLKIEPNAPPIATRLKNKMSCLILKCSFM